MVARSSGPGAVIPAPAGVTHEGVSRTQRDVIHTGEPRRLLMARATALRSDFNGVEEAVAQ